MEATLLPKRPYLLRGYYDWFVDNNLTPYLVVDATYPEVKVPFEYVQNGQIILNISTNATGNLTLGNDAIEFNARFKGVNQQLFIPLGAVLAIYARENGDGVLFEDEAFYDIANQQPKSSLRFVEVESQSETEENSPTSSTEDKSTSPLKFI